MAKLNLFKSKKAQEKISSNSAKKPMPLPPRPPSLSRENSKNVKNIIQKAQEEPKMVDEKPSQIPSQNLQNVKTNQSLQPKIPPQTNTQTNNINQKNVAENKEIKTNNNQDTIFKIDLKPKMFYLPDIDDRTKTNIRYPLIPPYAYAHIYWNSKENELMYDVEEPKLTNVEMELLKLIRLGMEELINISFVKAAKSKIVIKYLEENVQIILREIGTQVSKETYNKIMYYIYRDSVGLNYIEPLMKDYYIEDIECNGVNFPIYIVHRKYENIKTNVIFKDADEMTDFVEKLAQKSGRYISYASPLLDGTLPDGSRVNATYTKDVTTRGPTFTIRKFTAEPMTPINLMSNGTISTESAAFLWLAIEYKFNVMIIGETSAGKTTFLNAISEFIPPEARICSIEDTRELNLQHINWLPAITRSGFGMPNIMGKEVGEIDLFDLLKETFRQNPDYVILGETRGAEASVLFQGMASGHPTMSTFHAASVETYVKRLETPPIELSPSLIETMDIICVITHAKERENKRRLKEVNEIISVENGLGRVDYNTMFKWNPISDKVEMKTTNSVILKKIQERTGQTQDVLKKELMLRTKLLNKLNEQNISDFKQFGTVIQQYYKNKKEILRKFGL